MAILLDYILYCMTVYISVYSYLDTDAIGWSYFVGHPTLWKAYSNRVPPQTVGNWFIEIETKPHAFPYKDEVETIETLIEFLTQF